MITIKFDKMNKGELYGVCALLAFGASLSGGAYIGLPWPVSLIIAVIPAVYFARKSAKWSEQ